MNSTIFIQRFPHGIAATEHNVSMAPSPLRRARRAATPVAGSAGHVTAGQGAAVAIARAATDSTTFGERNT